MTAPSPILRPPTLADGAAVWELAHAAGGLDANTSYAYLLWCRDFADTSVVALDASDALVGFVTGYRRPTDPEALFVWQVATDPSARGSGLAGRMLEHLLDRLVPVGVRYLEATVTPSNEASARLFARVARRRGAPLVHPPAEDIGAEWFPVGGEAHEAERALRIGPVLG